MLEVLHPHNDRPQHRDKLAATKKHDEEVHEALRAAREAEKEKRHQETIQAAKAYKQERAFKMEAEPELRHSKRAVKEAREAAKKSEKQGEVHVCPHGVNKCRICFPPKAHKKLEHGHDRAPPVPAGPGSAGAVDSDDE